VSIQSSKASRTLTPFQEKQSTTANGRRNDSRSTNKDVGMNLNVVVGVWNKTQIVCPSTPSASARNSARIVLRGRVAISHLKATPVLDLFM
jgi:hypothetical protein